MLKDTRRTPLRRVAPLTALAITVGLVVGCTPATPGAGPSASPSDPAASSTASPRPTPSASATAAPPAPTDPLAGTCDELLTPAQVATLLSPSAESRGDESGASSLGGRGSTDPDIIALMPAGGRHCTWGVPGTDEGIVVSVLAADSGVRGAVAAETATYYRADAGPGVTYRTFESLDSFIFTETHALGDGATNYWVAVFTTGSNAREIAEIIWLDLIGT